MVTVCKYCGGHKKITCPKCKGTGIFFPSAFAINGEECPLCNGKKMLPCPHCKKLKRRAL